MNMTETLKDYLRPEIGQKLIESQEQIERLHQADMRRVEILTEQLKPLAISFANLTLETQKAVAGLSTEIDKTKEANSILRNQLKCTKRELNSQHFRIFLAMLIAVICSIPVTLKFWFAWT